MACQRPGSHGNTASIPTRIGSSGHSSGKSVCRSSCIVAPQDHPVGRPTSSRSTWLDSIGHGHCHGPTKTAWSSSRHWLSDTWAQRKEAGGRELDGSLRLSGMCAGPTRKIKKRATCLPLCDTVRDRGAEKQGQGQLDLGVDFAISLKNENTLFFPRNHVWQEMGGSWAAVAAVATVAAVAAVATCKTKCLNMLCQQK